VERIRLGRTELKVSPAGLGCGGYSRLGMATGGDESSAEKVVNRALELGINFFDTARAYGTEEVVGRCVANCREDVVISSKTMFRREDSYMPVSDLVESLEKSLVRLKSDYVDVFSLHGVTEEHLDYCLSEFVPALEQQKALGKIRHIGIESFRQDPEHKMLARAIPTGCFDVVMVGFNFLNAAARDEVFRLAQEHDVATQIMHAVRRALSNSDVMRETVAALVETGEIDPEIVDVENPLGFIEDAGESITNVAYRYCRHEPGVSVVLTGTGSPEHLSENAQAICSEPVPEELVLEINKAFGRVRSASAD